MNLLKESLLNQLIRIPAVRTIAKRHHETGISANPELLTRYYGILTEHASVAGKSLLELGPGKTIELVLQAKQDGASSVAIADIEPYLSADEAERLGVDYKIYDGKKLPFADESFDLIWSTTVYEHVRFPEEMVKETWRLLKKGGMVVHIIDLMDHFAHGRNRPDLVFNCLKYPKWVWEGITWNRSNFVNRLRASEWVDLHESAGFDIVSKDCETSSYIQENYRSDPQLSYLTRFSEADAISTWLYLAARK
jgi:ubiquinone/menaquinone biosynthesis C-methylase UbiE